MNCTINYIPVDEDSLLTEKEQLEKKRQELQTKCLFLAKTAHEIKNIIIAISGVCHQLVETNEGSSSEDEDGKCSQSPEMKSTQSISSYLQALCNFGLSLIEDLNTFTRLERQDFSPSSYLNRTISSSQKDYKIIDALDFCLGIFKLRQMRDPMKRNLKIKSFYQVPKLEKVSITETKLKQVVINLLSNAYKFTFSGEIELSCESITVDGQNLVRIKVSDTGVGISNVEKVNLFNPFKVIERNQYLNVHGSGLGLYIINEILSQYGSKLEMSSCKNVGSSFWFDLGEKEMKNVNVSVIDVKEMESVHSVYTESSDCSPAIDQHKFFTQSLKNLLFEINNGNRDLPLGDMLPPSEVPDNNNSLTEKNDFLMQVIQEESSPRTRKKKFDMLETKKSFEKVDKLVKKFSLEKVSKFFPKHFAEVAQCNIRSVGPSTLKKTLLDIQNYEDYNTDPSIGSIRSRSHGGHRKSATKKKSSHTNSLKKLKILICDDEPISAISAKNVIRKSISENKDKYLFDPEIYLTNNGIECLFKLYQFCLDKIYVDILIIDENMPFLNGSTVARLIKSMAADRYMNDILIYLFSSNEGFDKQSLGNGYLEKPMKKKSFTRILQENYKHYVI